MSSTTQQDRAARPGGIEEREPVSGWVLFAGCALLIIGCLDALWGLAAVLNGNVVTVGGHGVVIWDVTAWGWVHLVLGATMALTGIGLFAQMTWARWLAVVFVSLDAIAQFGIFTSFPLWALLMIALDVTIVYQLTARWQS